MSNSWYILPYKPPNWETKVDISIDPEDYGNELRKRFPNAKIHLGDSWPLSWELNNETELGITGELQPGGQIVSFKSHGVNFLDFILWHRQYVPSHYELFLFNDSSVTNYLNLQVDTTLQELTDFISSG